MAAESLPLAGGTGTLPGWELEAWYQDLQEVLAAAEPGGHHPLPRGAEQEGPAELATLDSTALLWSADEAGAAGCELDAALAAELLELLGPESPASTEPAAPPPPGSASSGSSPAQTGTEDEEGVALGRGAKRKRHGSEVGGREPAKRRERELANEQRVQELTAHNERLREEIQRLSAEVERTRAALIDRIVNLRQA
ncbi:DNA damage-inducible transcript 3 protein [Rhea pennata]|uniref:DNA damage-inducible transcript 3 protein n=1 Tax=Rhea pennata TaxID=8795 RepID=UPI002E25D9AF